MPKQRWGYCGLVVRVYSIGHAPNKLGVIPRFHFLPWTTSLERFCPKGITTLSLFPFSVWCSDRKLVDVSNYGTTVWVLYVSLNGGPEIWKKRKGQENDLRPGGNMLDIWKGGERERESTGACAGCHSSVPTCSLLASLSWQYLTVQSTVLSHYLVMSLFSVPTEFVFIIMGVVIHHSLECTRWDRPMYI